MESMEGNGGGRLVVTELSHIKELVKQLEVHLGGSPDLCKHLTSEIFSVTERSIGIIRSGQFDGHHRKRTAGGDLDSATPSPLSDVSDLPFKATKKSRKASMEKKRHQIRVSSRGGVENPPVDDGYSWRKYGQKEILGAKHPRGYYRCTHRNSQGCMATKQVQRTDGDATLFDVIYHGDHTCHHQKAAVAIAGKPQPEMDTNAARSRLHDLSCGLTVKTELMPPFCLSSLVSGLATPENYCLVGVNGVPSVSPSPATSDSNHISVASAAVPFPVVAGDAEWRDAEFQEVLSALVTATAAAPPPTMDADEGFEFDPDFTIDITSFFA